MVGTSCESCKEGAARGTARAVSDKAGDRFAPNFLDALRHRPYVPRLPASNRRSQDLTLDSRPRASRLETRTTMANTPQARKRIRRNARRAEINGSRMSRIRTFVKKVEAAIEGGDKEAAQNALRAAQPELARGVARGVLHKNTASRKMSRLSKRVSAL